MADLTLAELLKQPIMPEEYDRFESPVMPHARAFGAGLVDPMGLPSWLIDLLARKSPQYSPIKSETADWYHRRMQEARDESPIAAGVGSAIVPSLVGLGSMGIAGELTGAEMAQGLPLLLQAGAALGGGKGALFPAPIKKRPQAGYPPGGAY